MGEATEPGNMLLKLDKPHVNTDPDVMSTPDRIYHHAEANPLLLKSSVGNHNIFGRDDDLFFTLSTKYPWPYKHGCFKNMFVTQPPATEVTAVYEHCGGVRWRTDHTFDNPNGVKVGELIAMANTLDDEVGPVRWRDCWSWASQRLMATPGQQVMACIVDGEPSG